MRLRSSGVERSAGLAAPRALIVLSAASASCQERAAVIVLGVELLYSSHAHREEDRLHISHFRAWLGYCSRSVDLTT
ncbi:MAG TPA: hypothetical protein VMN79_10080 [Casimicrobiaceae bacterium]|nr:hypothetical protein [Casimicrobiaceae bacterium]